MRGTAAGAAAAGSGIQAEVEDTVTEHAFDVATAIALAGCAFESYNEPAGVPEALKEWSVNGTYTTYVDR